VQIGNKIAIDLLTVYGGARLSLQVSVVVVANHRSRCSVQEKHYETQ
jgi:hypothetical protein